MCRGCAPTVLDVNLGATRVKLVLPPKGRTLGSVVEKFGPPAGNVAAGSSRLSTKIRGSTNSSHSRARAFQANPVCWNRSQRIIWSSDLASLETSCTVRRYKSTPERIAVRTGVWARN